MLIKEFRQNFAIVKGWFRFYDERMRTLRHQKIFRLALAGLTLVLLGSCQRERVVDYPAIREKASAFLALHSCEMIYRDVSYFAHKEKVLGLFESVDKRLLFAVQIRVRAGIDLKSAGSNALQVEPLATGERPVKDSAPIPVRVRMPAPSIVLVDADDQSLYEYFAVARGAQITRNDWDRQIAAVRERVRADAIARGILQRAGANARTMVRNLLALSGLDVVEFIETTGVEASAPAAPVPANPQEAAP